MHSNDRTFFLLLKMIRYFERWTSELSLLVSTPLMSDSLPMLRLTEK
jgi:hypothetical protein